MILFFKILGLCGEAYLELSQTSKELIIWIKPGLKKKNDIIWSFSFQNLNFSPWAEFPRLFLVPVSEAAIQRCSRKKVLLKSSQNSQGNTYVRFSFLNKGTGLRLAQNIGLLKQANFLADVQKNKSKTQICEHIQSYKRNSSLLQMR